MTWQNQWTVLVPGDAALVEKRTREILEDFDEGNEYTFIVIPGQGRYHAIVETGSQETELENVLGNAFSRESAEPVYSIEGREEEPYVSRFVSGVETWVDEEPEALVRSLGCTVPWFDAPPPPPLLERQLKAVALIQGVSVAKIRKMLGKVMGQSLPVDYYRLEETPHGVLLTDGTTPLGSAHIWLTERLPRATVYSVTATPTLDFFVVTVMHGSQTLKFSFPPTEDSFFPAVHEIMGERTPEAILAAMGIPKEWFKL